MTDLIARFLQDETGSAAIEYGLLAALVAVPMIAAAKNVGEKINGLFLTIAAALQ